ncbi:15-hydroxyprostaglandin dehydrogenase [NAD(+)]-like isoform X2 [Diabrotica undecimpunctata]|uniref:15-hydroxyprostaglandin dehydrogenase [NAD(+)]-like isoform X2 n=1 Tax=Diabrotica undecimpunctata TaxID=50387 RepID=UPI003B632816
MGLSVVDINENIGQNAVEMLKQEFGPKVIFIKTDISDYKSFENAFKVSLEHYKNIDILFNNAGIHNDMEYSKEIDVNVKGTMNGVILGIEKYLKHHRSGEEGVIVNTSSIAGLEATLLPTYSATKFAVNGITINWGTKLHYDDSKVRVFGICPGYTDTEINTNVELKKFRPSLRKAWADYSPYFDMFKQSAEFVAEEAIKLLSQAPNGSLWVIEHTSPAYQVIWPRKNNDDNDKKFISNL